MNGYHICLDLNFDLTRYVEMIGLNIVTGPSFLGGLLVGLNRRLDPEFKHDPWAPYKLLSLTTTFAVLKSMANDLPPAQKGQPGKVLLSSLIASPIVCGSVFCMGLMLTKIPRNNIRRHLLQ